MLAFLFSVLFFEVAGIPVAAFLMLAAEAYGMFSVAQFIDRKFLKSS